MQPLLKKSFSLLAFCSVFLCSQAKGADYVTVNLMGQLGNQMFQIATAYACSLDNDVPLLIPDLVEQKGWNIPHNAERLFLDRISAEHPSSRAFSWREPSLHYHPIPARKSVRLFGYFQCERYFKHRREEILTLFAPPSDLKEEIESQYPFLFSDEQTVGVQIRDYRLEGFRGSYHPTFGRDYYEKAMALFPDETLFVVSSNNIKLAKEATEGLKPNILYLEENDYIKEFFILTFCKSFIISNSSFGWWAAWLSTAPDKVCVVPNPWFLPPYPPDLGKDIPPEGSIIIKSQPL